jgi:hypothetical protein
MLDQETINVQLDLLAAHRRTLAALLQQQAPRNGAANFSGITSSIDETREHIRRIKATLRANGVPVEEQPLDEDRPVASQPRPGPQRDTDAALKGRLQTATGLLLLTVLIGVFTNIATGNAWGEHTWVAWALLALCVGGAVGLTVRQIQLERGETTATVTPETNRGKMLKKVNDFWIEGVLNQSLYRIARLELGLEQAPERVSHPWETVVQREISNRTVPPGTRMIDLFDELDGKMLILRSVAPRSRTGPEHGTTE